MVVRLFFAVIISITVLFLDIARFHTGLVVTCVVLVGMNAALARMAVDRGGLGVLSAWPEAIAIGVWAALLPDQMWAAVTIFAGYFAYVAIAFGRRVVALMSGVCLVPIVIGVVVGHPAQQGAILSLYVVMSLSAILLIGHAADEATEVRGDFEAMLDALDVVLWDVSIDKDEPYTLVGPIERLTGLPLEFHRRQGSWYELVHPDDVARVDGAQESLERGEDHVLRYRLRLADGNFVWWQDDVHITRGADGRVIGSRGFSRVVEDEMRNLLTVAQFTDFVEAVPFGVLIAELIDPADHRSLEIRSVNPSLCVLSHREASELVGQPLAAAYPEAFIDSPEGDSLLRSIASAARSGVDFDVQFDVPAPIGTVPIGTVQESRTIALRVVGLQGAGVALVFDEITARVRAEVALAQRATTDALTGLANRSLLLDRLEAIGHEPSIQHVTLLVVDLDRFKDVNDTFGHERGDVFLQKVADRFRTALPAESLLARLGGDEFAILLAPGSTIADGIAAAHAIEASLVEPIAVAPWLTLQASASVGIASMPDHADTVDALLVRADVAMYSAKRSGLRYALYEPQNDRSSVRRMVLLGDLRRAISSGELVLHYQPVVDRDGVIVGAEGLVRWQHPELGLVFPDEFIELVEVGSLSHPLVLTVVRQALQQARTLHAMGFTMGVSVNLTPRDLCDAELIRTVAQLVEEARLPHHSITVELTERQLLADTAAVTASVLALHTAGVRIAIDDFGTGSTSLYLLRRLEVDELKIDRVFIDDLRNGHDSVVRSIIELAHDLGMSVTAEGVEEMSVCDQLRELGCDRMQGFAIARPMPPERLTELLMAAERTLA